jgi:hypothetical protein
LRYSETQWHCNFLAFGNGYLYESCSATSSGLHFVSVKVTPIDQSVHLRALFYDSFTKKL